MGFRLGELPGHSRTLIFFLELLPDDLCSVAWSPVLLVHCCSVNRHHCWQLGIKNFDVFLCIDDFIWFHEKYRALTFHRKASPNHYLLWMLHCRHCEPSVVSHVSRSSKAIEVIEVNWQNILSLLNMTRDHWAVVQFMHFRQKWSLFVTCFELRSGFRAACRLRRLNSSQRRRLTVLRLAFTHGTSFFTSEALRNSCFLIALSIAMSSLRVVHLSRPERCRLNTLPVSSNNFNVLPTDALLPPTLRAIAEYDSFSLASATITDRFVGVSSAAFPNPHVVVWYLYKLSTLHKLSTYTKHS